MNADTPAPADTRSGLAHHVNGRPPAVVKLPVGTCDTCGVEEHVSWCRRHRVHECGECCGVCMANGTWALGGGYR